MPEDLARAGGWQNPGACLTLPLSDRAVQPNVELDVRRQAAWPVSVGSQLPKFLDLGRSWPEFSRSVWKLTVDGLLRELSRQYKLCASLHSLAPCQFSALAPDSILTLKCSRPSQVISTTLSDGQGETLPEIQETFQVRCWHAGLGEDFKPQ